jgi:hypothetical protein
VKKTWALGAVAFLVLAQACTAKKVVDLTTLGVGGGIGGNDNSSSHVSASHTGVTTATGTGGGAPNCGSLVWSTNATCEACIEGMCCDQLAACDTGTPCGALLDCANACNNDSTCIMNCGTSQAAGQADFKALNDCQTNSCATDCPSGICTSGVTTNNAACDTCGTDQCCTEWTTCQGDPTCSGCVGNSSPSCTSNALLKAAEDCLHTKCTTDCPPGFCDSGVTSGNAVCDMCGTTNCCAEWKACTADTTCEACIGSSSTACANNALIKAAEMCLSTKCTTQCM